MALPINENFEQNNAFPNTQTQPTQIPIAGAPGKSAYEMAKLMGFTGTQAEWMASLQGSQGIQGVSGADGKDGADAPAPTNDQIAAAVAAYLAAYPPASGRDGANGKDGSNGRDAPAPTNEQVAAAVTTYLVANPPAQGPKGDPGDAPSAGQIQAAVNSYVAANPPAAGKDGINGKDGAKGDPGLNANSQQIYDAAAAFLTANPPPRGLQGLKGDKGDTGATGPSGAVILGTVNFSRTALVALTAGLQTWTMSGVSGVLANDNILLFPVSPLPAGYAIHNVVATGTGALSVTYTGPLLALGASFSIPCRVVALR